MSIKQWLFGGMSDRKKISRIRTHAVILGSRIKEGRKFYFYLLHDFFVEVLFRNDNLLEDPERLRTFATITDLNGYLNREFEKAF